ncbi:MAG: hypothetical protein ACM3O5_02360 [Betaproteobacteria bacterium]
MSATATLANQVRHDDQFKMIRAESAVSWFATAFDAVIDVLKIDPAEVAASGETGMPKGFFGICY